MKEIKMFFPSVKKNHRNIIAGIKKKILFHNERSASIKGKECFFSTTTNLFPNFHTLSLSIFFKTMKNDT